MKKIFSNNRLIAVAFLTIFSFGLSTIAVANDKDPVVPVELKYSGLVQNNPMFELNFSGNAEQNSFTIIISDEYGNSFYRENIKGEHFTKKFLLNTNEIGDENLKFEVFCNKTKKSVLYVVNRNTRTVQDIAITMVK